MIYRLNNYRSLITVRIDNRSRGLHRLPVAHTCRQPEKTYQQQAETGFASGFHLLHPPQPAVLIKILILTSIRKPVFPVAGSYQLSATNCFLNILLIAESVDQKMIIF